MQAPGTLLLTRSDVARVLTLRECIAAVEGGFRLEGEGRLQPTCTSSTQVVLEDADVGPGVFVAAVGADNEHKWEIDPRLLARSRVVVDNLNQCATIGDLHHAIEHGTMTRETVHGDLGSVVAAKTPGRERDEEITLFDSTGIALQDAVTAVLVLRRAVDEKLGTRFDFFA